MATDIRKLEGYDSMRGPDVSANGSASAPMDGYGREPIPNYKGYEQKRGEIWEAWKFLREHNHTVPDKIIDFMRDAALEKMRP